MKTKMKYLRFALTFVLLALILVSNQQAGAAGVKIGLVSDVGGISDNSWNWLAYQGLLQAETDLGIDGTLYEPTDVSQYETLLQQCVTDGNELCIAIGFTMGDAVQTVASANPTKKFAILDYTYETPSANLRGTEFDEKQAGYLAGALAGKMTTSDTIGVVAGMEIGPVIDFAEGYRNGAQCANPDANVLIDYTGSFDNPTLGADTAQDMISQGADVIFAAAGVTGNGAILYSAQHDVFSIGVDNDQYLSIFGSGTVDGSDKLLTSAMKRLDNAVYQTIQDYLGGTFNSQTAMFELSNNGVGLAPYHETDTVIPQAVKDYVAGVEQGILDGNVNVNFECDPRFHVQLTQNNVEGYGWTLGASVTLTIDTDNNGTPEFTSSPQTVVQAEWDPNQTVVRFDNVGGIDLAAGMYVTMTDGTTTKTHTITTLTLTSINPATDTLTGTAPPNSYLEVGHLCDESGCAIRHINANASGNWVANFSVPGAGSDPDEQRLFNIVPGTGSEIRQSDEDGDHTDIDWYVLDPHLQVFVTSDRIEAREWPLGNVVTLRINRPSTPQNPDYTTTRTVGLAPWDSNQYLAEFDLNGIFHYQVGDVVTVTDGTLSKTHTVSNIAVTNMNVAADTIAGTATAGTEVVVEIYRGGAPYRMVTANGSGNWSANFSVPWSDQGTYDLTPGLEGAALRFDVDGDASRADWRIPDPVIQVRASFDEIELVDWQMGNTVTLQVDDPGTGTNPDYSTTAIIEDWTPWGSGQTYAYLSLAEDFDIQSGFIVSASDGVTTKTHTVLPLEFTNIDIVTDVVTGVGKPNSQVDVWTCPDSSPCINRHVDTDSGGNWTADFAHPGTEDDEQETSDLTYGSWVDSSQWDDDGDTTMYGMNVPNSRIIARINENTIEGNEWPDGATVTLKIDDPDVVGTENYTDSQEAHYPPWDSRNTYLRFELDGFILEPGHIVTMTDGDTTKVLTVVDIEATGWNLSADTISGTAPANADVWVNVWETDDWTPRHIQANALGNWTADFGHMGDEDFEQFTYNIINGSTGEAGIEDEDNDASAYTWDTYTVWVAPSTVPLVVALNNDFDLRRPGYSFDDFAVLNLLYEPLFRLGDNATLIPAAALNYSVSTNGLVYTIPLRANKWSNGQAVTAQDYVDGILRNLHPDTATDYAILLFDIQGAEGYNNGSITDKNAVGVKALNATTLQITLAQKSAYFSRILATPAISPIRMAVLNQYPNSWTDPARFVANGPYKLLEHDKAHFLLVKNPYYYNTSKVLLPQVGFSIFRDPDEPFEAYKRGEIDVVLDAPGETYTDTDYRFERVYSDLPGVQYIGLNLQQDPTTNLLVRKALASATDREAILDLLGTPWRQTATGVIPPELPGYQGNAVGFAYNPTQAQQFLADAGYPGGAGLPTIHIYANPIEQLMMDALATQWETVLGISVETHYQDNFYQWLQNCEANPGTCEYNGFRMRWYVDYFDAHNIIDDLFNPDHDFPKFMNWDNARYRELIQLSRAELDPAVRIPYLQEAEEILVETDAAVIPLYFSDRVSLVKPGFKTVFGNVPYFEQWSFKTVLPPAAFGKTSPANNALKQPVNATLKWAASINAVEYEYCIDTVSNTVCDTSWEITPSTSVNLSGLTNNQTYYWQVRALNALGTVYANTGAWWNFKVVVSPPSPVSPNDGDHILTLRPTFDWTDVAEAGVIGYTIQISTSSAFSSIAHTGNPITSTYTPSVDLPKGKLYWRVQTRSANGPSLWSEARWYQGPYPPAAPVLNLPANNALVTDYTPLFKWNVLVIPAGAPAFDKYQIQVATDPGFAPGAIVLDEENVGLTSNQFTPTVDFDPNTKYYWRVRGVDTLPENGAWSLVRAFRTVVEPPVLVLPADGFSSKELRPFFDWDAPSGPGAITGYTIQISRNSAFTQIVHTGSPVGSSYTPMVDLPKGAGVTLYWRVLTKGVNGPSAYSAHRSLTMPANPPLAPALLLPALNALVTDYTPTFTWNAVLNADHYIIQVDDNVDFSSPVIDDDSTVTPTFTPVIDLTSNTKYYWRVRAFNAAGEMSNWSVVRYFRTVLQPPVLVLPADGFASMELRPFFDWDAPSGPEIISGYTIQISRNSAFTQIVHTGNPVGSSYTPTVDLPKGAGMTLYWRVLTKGANGPSAYSASRSLTMPVNPPLAPTLLLPALNALVTDYTPAFTWNSVLNADHYIIQVDNNSDFTSPESSGTPSSTTFTPGSDLASNTKFFWRVRAVNVAGEMSNWSAVRYFRTIILPPDLSTPANDATNVPLKPTFTWNNVPGNIGYTLQIWKKGATPVLVKAVTVPTNILQYTFTTNLLPNTEYFWKVQTKASNGPSLWSETFDFTTTP
ncbi:MAG: BMP family ABC transporter substrate-binding protein [Chloroflexi bacterium]|nr:BMP family ABC transporter substrate-binding protein [Chloroflexota bacterium]